MVTVKELIEKLKSFDENMEVVIEDDEGGRLMESADAVSAEIYSFRENGNTRKEYCNISMWS